MLENIRERSQGLTAKIILGLVILTFALAGVGSYTNSVDTSIAEVNGEKISQKSFDQAYQSQRSRMQQQFGEMFETLASDANYMANFRNGIVDNLINEKLVDQSVVDLALKISDAQIKNTIREMKEFQVDGIFDNNRYLAIINQAGFFQSSDFRDYLRQEMARRQLTQSLISSEFNLPYQEELSAALTNQKRDIRFATISAEQFKADTEVTAEQISNYYDENLARFQNQEKIKVNYIALNVQDIAKNISVTDEEITRYYQENISSYTQAEQRRVAHILFEFGDDEQAAKVQATKILARINDGEDYAALAKEFSNDVLSAENGGDLEWIDRGTMGDIFDDSAFSLASVGSVGRVIKTDFGFHIIKLTDLKPETIQTVAQVKDELTKKVSDEKAQDTFFELQQEMARISYEFPDSLDDAAGAINAEVQTSTWLSHGRNAAPFDNAKVIKAAFSRLVLTDLLNSDIIEINDDLVMVLRLNEYQEAKVKPLTEVEAQIKSTLVAQYATDKAQALVAELLEEFKAGTDITAQLAAIDSQFITKVDIGRYGSDVDTNIVREAFILPHDQQDKVSASSVTLGNGDLALVEVQAVKAGETTADANLSQQQVSQLAQSSYQGYVETLKTQAKITRRTQVAESTNQY